MAYPSGRTWVNALPEPVGLSWISELGQPPSDGMATVHALPWSHLQILLI